MSITRLAALVVGATAVRAVVASTAMVEPDTEEAVLAGLDFAPEIPCEYRDMFIARPVHPFRPVRADYLLAANCPSCRAACTFYCCEGHWVLFGETGVSCTHCWTKGERSEFLTIKARL